MPELRQRREQLPDARQALSGVLFLFGYFLFEHAKRK